MRFSRTKKVQKKEQKKNTPATHARDEQRRKKNCPNEHNENIMGIPFILESPMAAIIIIKTINLFTSIGFMNLGRKKKRKTLRVEGGGRFACPPAAKLTVPIRVLHREWRNIQLGRRHLELLKGQITQHVTIFCSSISLAAKSASLTVYEWR